MRFVGRSIAALTLLAGLAWPAPDAARPLVLEASRQPARPIALLWQATGARVTAVDETSLRPIRPRSVPVGAVDAWAFSPDGSRLALAAHPNANQSEPDSIRFLRLPTLKLVKHPILLDGTVRALLWNRPDRLVALIADCCSPAAVIDSVDPVARRVVTRQRLDGAVLAIARTADSLVLLLGPDNAIGVARLLVVGDDGSIGSARLDRVSAGYSWPANSSTDPIGTQRVPGLAVDRVNERAYVIQPEGPAAEIGLQKLDVAYHDLAAPRSLLSRLARWLEPSAQAKGMNGPARQARWLGDGLIALTGSNESASRDAGGHASFASSPAGLAIVDTNDWTLRMLDSGADSATVADGALLATGRSWSSATQTPHGMGLAVYGPDRALRFRLWPGTSAWVDAVFAGRAYINVTTGGTTATTFVVDLGSGSVLGERRSAVPVPLLSAGPDS